MAEVNQAWQVLGDPVRRRAYDRTLGDSVAPPRPSTAPPSQPAPEMIHAPSPFPWRFFAVLGVVGVGLAILGLATASDPPEPRVDNLLGPGDCVIIEVNGDAAETLCSQPHDGTVEALLPLGETCPVGTEPHRDKQGLGTACVKLD